MAEDSSRFFAVLTDSGAALEAVALELGKGIVLTHIVVGDANLQNVTPDPSAVSLIHEVCRRPIDARSRDQSDPRITLLHATIPAEIGGFWIHEMGVVGHLEGEEEEVLYAYANHSRYYKMLPSEGQTITHELTIPIIQCTDAQVSISVTDSGYATRTEYLILSSLVEALRNIQRASWTLEEGIAEGGTLSFPNELVYAPGHHAVCLTFDGVSCHEGPQFLELEAEEDGLARGVALQFAAPAGSEFEVLILGHSDAMPLNDAEAANPSGLTARVSALEEQISTVSQLSENAVYLGEMVTEE